MSTAFEIIDVHSHLNLSHFDGDREVVVARMEAEKIGTIVIGVDLESSRRAVALADAHAHIWASVGLHPADNRSERFDEGRYIELLQHKRVVAVGECGLDYYRGADEAEKNRQKELFERQIVFAKQHDLPLMLHGRPSKGTMDAYRDIIEILSSQTNARVRGNVHFFVGDIATARRFLDLNFTLSFTGVITFSRDYDEVIRFLPEEMILAETDAPFAAPEPYRGKRCDPLHVKLVAEKLAEIRAENTSDFRHALLKNTKTLFGV